MSVPASQSATASSAMSEQLQFQLFQESLRKINQLVYTMLLNEIVPLSISIDKNLEKSDDIKSIEATKEELDKLTLDDEKNESSTEDHNQNRLKGIEPSHKLIFELTDTKDETKYNNVLNRVRNIGFQIGNKLSELLIFTNNPNLQFKDMDLLLIMKFICRDVWKQLFNKQIDNLKTNHRGTFYLSDYNYQPIQNFSIEDGESKKELKLVEPFLEFPVGIIKGVLASLGYPPDQIICLATFIDSPNTDKPMDGFPKGISFHVQVTSQQSS